MKIYILESYCCAPCKYFSFQSRNTEEGIYWWWFSIKIKKHPIKSRRDAEFCFSDKSSTCLTGPKLNAKYNRKVLVKTIPDWICNFHVVLFNDILWYWAPAKHQRPFKNPSLEVVDEHVTVNNKHKVTLFTGSNSKYIFYLNAEYC